MAENRQYLSRVTLRGVTDKYLCRNNLTIKIKKHRFHIISSNYFFWIPMHINALIFPANKQVKLMV